MGTRKRDCCPVPVSFASDTKLVAVTVAAAAEAAGIIMGIAPALLAGAEALLIAALPLMAALPPSIDELLLPAAATVAETVVLGKTDALDGIGAALLLALGSLALAVASRESAAIDGSGPLEADGPAGVEIGVAGALPASLDGMPAAVPFDGIDDDDETDRAELVSVCDALVAAADSVPADPMPAGDTGPDVGGLPRGVPLIFFSFLGNIDFLFFVKTFLFNDKPGSSTVLRPLRLLARVSNSKT